MAKNNVKPAAAAQPAVQKPQVENPSAEIQEDNVIDEIRNKNIGEANIAELAKQQLKDEQNKRLIEEKKRKIAEAEYINLKARLMLRARRREANATKDYLKETKELLNQLTGYTNDKGEVVAPTLTIFQYEEKRREITKKKNEAFRDSDRQYSDELKELRFQYPSYYCYEWDN